jgi:hypothetical protein
MNDLKPHSSCLEDVFSLLQFNLGHVLLILVYVRVKEAKARVDK